MWYHPTNKQMKNGKSHLYHYMFQRYKMVSYTSNNHTTSTTPHVIALQPLADQLDRWCPTRSPLQLAPHRMPHPTR